MDKKKLKVVKSDTKKSNKKNAVVISLCVVAFLALALVVYFNMDIIYSSENKSDCYPVNFTSNDVVEIQPLGSSVAVLTKKSVHILDKRGNEDLSFSFTLAEPAISTNGKHGVIYDRRSDSYLFFDSSGYNRNGITENNAYIYFAQVSEKGDLVIVTKSSNSACNLYMYDKNGNETFAWACGDEYIVSADINPKTKEILCGAIGAYSGEICTKAYLLDPDKNEPVIREYTIPSSACIDVQLYNDNAIILCDNKLSVFDTDKAEDTGIVTSFTSSVLRFATDGEGNTAIITESSDEANAHTLSVYDGKGKLSFNKGFENEIKGLYFEKGRVYLLDGREVRQIAKNGSEKESYNLNRKALGIIACGGNVYCYSLGGVERASVS